MPEARVLFAALSLTAALAATGDGLAPGLRFLVRDGRVCDTAEVICLAASITYEPNRRLIELGGRVEATTEPGILVLVFSGHARDGSRRYAEMRVPLDGRYSEIARGKIIPDWPEVEDWALDHARFEPPREADGAR